MNNLKHNTHQLNMKTIKCAVVYKVTLDTDKYDPELLSTPIASHICLLDTHN